MKDLNKLKEEAFEDFVDGHKSNSDSNRTNRIAWSMGWDACVKAMGEKEPKLTIHARKLKFTAEVIAICDNNIKITDKVFTEFIEHWTEHNPKGKQMRFEKQTFFDILKRLRTFKANDKKWNPKDTVGGEKKPTVMAGNYMSRFK